MSKVKIISLSLALLILLWIAVAQSRRVTRLDLVAAQGNAVVDALERHRADIGLYPDSLEQLIPRYLLNVPSPSYGTGSWVYSNGGNSFNLYVLQHDQTYVGMYYIHEEGRWEYES